MWMYLFAACAGESPSTPPPSRGDVAPPPPKATAVEAFCETSDKGPFTWPALADGAAPAAATGWRWVNVWATWCKPCIAEMPMLVGWQKKLAASGIPIELSFLSVDDGPVVVDDFYKMHPDMPKGVRIKSVDLVPKWLPQIGLDASAMLPLHVFIDPQQKIRCEKMGSLGESDFAGIEKMLRETR